MIGLIEQQYNGYDENIRWVFQRADGFLDLGMIDHAHHELDKLPEKYLPGAVYSHFLLNIAFAQEDWAEATDRAREVIDECPENPEYWVKLAYAMRRAYSVEDAERVLKQALKRFPDIGIFPYNLACYSAVLKKPDKAILLLERAVEQDPNYLEMAMNDKDLESVIAQFIASRNL